MPSKGWAILLSTNFSQPDSCRGLRSPNADTQSLPIPSTHPLPPLKFLVLSIWSRNQCVCFRSLNCSSQYLNCRIAFWQNSLWSQPMQSVPLVLLQPSKTWENKGSWTSTWLWKIMINRSSILNLNFLTTLYIHWPPKQRSCLENQTKPNQCGCQRYSVILPYSSGLSCPCPPHLLQSLLAGNSERITT